MRRAKFVGLDDLQKPVVHGFMPETGPRAGGTLLTVSGTYLDVGSDVGIVLTNGNVSVECSLIQRGQDSVVCATAAIEGPNLMDTLLVKIDSASVSYSGHQTFEFMPDPVIDMVFPEKTINRCVYHTTFVIRCSGTSKK